MQAGLHSALARKQSEHNTNTNTNTNTKTNNNTNANTNAAVLLQDRRESVQLAGGVQ
jgi:hypothetical protein